MIQAFYPFDVGTLPRIGALGQGREGKGHNKGQGDEQEGYGKKGKGGRTEVLGLRGRCRSRDRGAGRFRSKKGQI